VPQFCDFLESQQRSFNEEAMSEPKYLKSKSNVICEETANLTISALYLILAPIKVLVTSSRVVLRF